VHKPVLPITFRIAPDTTFNIKGKVYIPVKLIPEKLQPYFKNSSYVPGSRPADY